MGLLDHKAIQNYIPVKVDIKDIHQLLNEQLGNKYKVTFVDKKNVARQLVGGSASDAILIEKNAYHRTFVYTDGAAQASTGTTDETYLYFDGATLKWWLALLHRNFGFIGVLILRMIYGNSEAFDKDIVDAIKTKHTIKQREINAGISSLWKKDRIKEVQ